MKYFVLNNSIVVDFDNKTYTIAKDNRTYDAVVKHITSGNFDLIALELDLSIDENNIKELTYGTPLMDSNNELVFFHSYEPECLSNIRLVYVPYEKNSPIKITQMKYIRKLTVKEMNDWCIKRITTGEY